MTMRMVNEGLLALFAKTNSVHFDMMQNQDDRFSSFSQNGVILLTKKHRRQKRLETRREPSCFSEDHFLNRLRENASGTIVFLVETDYIIDRVMSSFL